MAFRLMKTPAISQLVTVSRRAAARLRQGHVWVYRSDLASPPEESWLGKLVSVADEQGNLIGTAIYSASSQIALRMLSSGPVRPEEFPSLVRDRIMQALRYRQRLGIVTNFASLPPARALPDAQPAPENRATDACRLVFSEADFLPGLIVDKYNDVLTLQVLTPAMDQPEIRDCVVNTLAEHLRPAAIVERVDARVRDLEQLPPRDSAVLWGDKTQTIFTLNGIRFHYDALEGQKTGAFLDQRENYTAAETHAHGDALDVFCYHGGFALHLARACRHVTAIDSSRPALDIARQNQQLNPAAGLANIDWVEGNAFDLLKEYSAAGRQYDTIVLDPPAFARSRRELSSALRGYKELNLRALKMLRPGGLLVTCSCSFHVSEADFLAMLRSAAADVRRTPRLLEKRGQATDHPVLLTVPETSYLKCLLLQL
jgi:23S rRNA (cytosine1962-C5)-methyltransferase